MSNELAWQFDMTKAYMEECCQDLKDSLNVLLGDREGIMLPHNLVMKLKGVNESQQKAWKRSYKICVQIAPGKKREIWT